MMKIDYICPFCGKHYTDFDKFIDCARQCKAKEDEKEKLRSQKKQLFAEIEKRIEREKNIVNKLLDEYKTLGGNYHFYLIYEDSNGLEVKTFRARALEDLRDAIKRNMEKDDRE